MLGVLFVSTMEVAFVLPDGLFKVVHVDRLAPWNGDHDSDHGLDEDAQPLGAGRVTPGSF